MPANTSNSAMRNEFGGAYTMTKTTATAMTGLAVALTAGTAAYVMNHKSRSAGKRFKRSAGKALKTLGGVIDSVEVMMR